MSKNQQYLCISCCKEIGWLLPPYALTVPAQRREENSRVWQSQGYDTQLSRLYCAFALRAHFHSDIIQKWDFHSLCVLVKSNTTKFTPVHPRTLGMGFYHFIQLIVMIFTWLCHKAALIWDNNYLGLLSDMPTCVDTTDTCNFLLSVQFMIIGNESVPHRNASAFKESPVILAKSKSSTNTHRPEHVSGAERWEFPLPAHVGVRSPRSTAQSRTRPLRSIPLPAHLQFHPAPVKSLHARSNLKFLCMPNTCRFQPKPYAWDTLPAWQTWSGFVAWLLQKKSASLLFCHGPRLRCGWTAPDTRVFRRQCGCLL